MNRLIRVLLLVPCLLAGAAGLRAEDKLAQTPYYPLQVGTTWHYRAGDSKFSVQVAKHEKVGDTLCARVEVKRDGKVVAWQHLAVTDDGVYRHDLTETSSGKEVTQTYKPPILVLKLPPKKGDSWKVDSKAGSDTFRGAFKIDEEEVKVSAGSYKAVRVSSQDLEVKGLKPVITTWYASGVGMVKQTIQEGNATGEIELEKFEPGK
jgi:hypothetical protein